MLKCMQDDTSIAQISSRSYLNTFSWVFLTILNVLGFERILSINNSAYQKYILNKQSKFYNPQHKRQ